jgi:DtxR family Mn-dependent transcriptional regulator
MNISAVMKEYLAETYRIAYYQDGNPYVSTSALAQVMGVSAPAVTRMVQRLKDGRYLEHQPYQGIALTPEGERQALASIRRHRLVERFLVDIMNFGWHEVHDAADDLEPAVSDIVVKRMEKLAGYPRRCPHGEPIPSADGVMPRVIDSPLTEVEPGKEYVVSRANTHDAEMLEYLGMLDLKPGVSFRLLERAPFEGPLQLALREQTHFIGFALAGVLRVCSQEEFDQV